ncbi:MAG TPA: hypothetical protein VF834_23290 [Streptosporangiaceae bacterium]
MCSSSVQRIARIGQAIDELAAEALAAYALSALRSSGQGGPDEAATSDAGQPGHEQADRAGSDEISDADQVVIRLARLWAELAELDPEVARRLPTYEA